MRTLLKRLIPVLILFVGTSAFAQFRIATVDLGRVFTNYWKTKEAKQAIEEHQADIEKQVKEMVTSFNKDKEDYQKVLDSVNDPAVSSSERDKRQKDAEAKLRDLKEEDDRIQQFERGSQSTLNDQLKRTHDNIISDISVVVKSRAKNDGYTFVIDTAAESVSGMPVVLYSVPGTNDLTDVVIKQLNAGAPLDTPKSDDKPLSEKKDSP